jgi:hypothetical protein
VTGGTEASKGALTPAYARTLPCRPSRLHMWSRDFSDAPCSWTQRQDCLPCLYWYPALQSTDRLCYTPRTSTKIHCRGGDCSGRQLYCALAHPQWSKEDRWTTDLHNLLTFLPTYPTLELSFFDVPALYQTVPRFATQSGISFQDPRKNSDLTAAIEPQNLLLTESCGGENIGLQYSTSHSHDVDESPSVSAGVQSSPHAEHGRSSPASPSRCFAATGAILTRISRSHTSIRGITIPSKSTRTAQWQSNRQASSLPVRQWSNSAAQPARHAS